MRGVESSLVGVSNAAVGVGTLFTKGLGGFRSLQAAAGQLVPVLGVLGGAAGFAGVALAINQALKEFAAYEQANLALQAVLQATQGAVGRTADDINQLADEIGSLGIATDDMVRTAASRLATFGSVAGAQFDQALRLANDLAVVGFGSLESASQALGIALDNPAEGFTRLRRAGIAFSETQKQLIRNFLEVGDVAGAQNVILAEVERRVGGSAARAGQGVAGSFVVLSDAIGDFFRIIGGGIANVTGLSENMRKFAEALNSINQQLAPASLDQRIQNQIALVAQLEENLRGQSRAMMQAVDQIERMIVMNEASAMALRQVEARLRGLTEQYRIQAEAFRQADIQREVLELGRAYAAADAQLAQFLATMARQRETFEGVRNELQRQVEGLRLTEQGQRALDAARRAGVTLQSEEGRQIAGLTAQIDALTFARQRLNVTYAGAQSMRESLMTETQLENEQYNLRLQQIQAYEAARLFTADEANQAYETAQFMHQQRLTQIQMSNDALRLNAMYAAGQEFVSFLQMAGQKSKALAIAAIALNTALRVAQTIQNTAAAAAAAMAQLGPIAGPPAAAAITAWGTAQVAAIVAAGALQGYGALKQGGPSLGGGGGGGVGSTPSMPGDSGEMKRTLVIEPVDPAAIFTGSQLNDLIDEINKQAENGKVVVANRLI